MPGPRCILLTGEEVLASCEMSELVPAEGRVSKLRMSTFVRASTSASGSVACIFLAGAGRGREPVEGVGEPTDRTRLLESRELVGVLLASRFEPK